MWDYLGSNNEFERWATDWTKQAVRNFVYLASVILLFSFSLNLLRVSSSIIAIFWRPCIALWVQVSSLLIVDTEKITADNGVRVKKLVPKIDLLAQQQAEFCKVKLLRLSTQKLLVRFLRSIATFSWFLKENISWVF